MTGTYPVLVDYELWRRNMDFGTAILYVLAVIAIMIVAGLVIYVLAALVVSIIDKKEVKPFSPDQERTSNREEENLLLDERSYQLTFEDEKPVEAKPAEEEQEAKELDNTIDLDLADEEAKELAARREAINGRANEEEEVSEEDDDLETLYQKLINDINSEATEEEAEALVEEPAEEPVEEVAEEEPAVEEVEVVEEPVEEEPQVDEEKEALKAQLAELQAKLAEKEAEPVQEIAEEPAGEVIEEEPAVEEVVEEPVKEEPQVDEEKEALKAQLAELQEKLAAEQAEKEAVKTQNEELEKKLEEKPATVAVEVETESLEALNARREVLAERLTESEKELRANKKEYVPLARIRKNLETDKAKLRRKEAVVAKQKVMLFGVSNYVVDPEKEKKLSEDLDVLDALRLSVQHCEEVMKENEDRYPILEKTNGILTKQVEDLRADLADIDARIAKLNNGDGEADAGNADAE